MLWPSGVLFTAAWKPYAGAVGAFLCKKSVEASWPFCVSAFAASCRVCAARGVATFCCSYSGAVIASSSFVKSLLDA